MRAINLCVAVVAMLLATAWASAQMPMTTAFTYQGVLTDSGSTPTGIFDFKFILYDAAIGGNVVGGPLFGDDLNVARGLFNVDLDFGVNAYDGNDRWLEIGVRPGSSGGAYTTLAPRQRLTPAPHAVMAAGLVLPYLGRVAANAPAFWIVQAGAREAGVFEIRNPANASPALAAFTNGTSWGLHAWNSGPGPAAFFDLPNVQNNKDVLECVHFGLGRAGLFENVNAANVNPVVEARHDGLGPAGYFWINNVASNSFAFKVKTLGLREAGIFEISNPGNAMTALTGFTNGTGLALQAWNTGTGGTAMLDIPNNANNSDVLSVLTVGGGRAGYFEINNPKSGAIALEVKTNGMGPAGQFKVNNALNATPAFIVDTNGPGPAIAANKTGPAGPGAIQASSNTSPGLEASTGNAAAPAIVALNPQGVALDAFGKIKTNNQFISTLAQGTAPLSVTSTTLNTNLNADLLDGSHLADLDARYVNEGQANSVATAMVQDRAVTGAKLAQNIDASAIGFNADMVDGVHAASVARVVTGYVAGNASVTINFPDRRPCQLWVSDDSANIPDQVAWISFYEQNNYIRVLGFNGDGTLVKHCGWEGAAGTVLTVTTNPDILVERTGNAGLHELKIRCYGAQAAAYTLIY